MTIAKISALVIFTLIFLISPAQASDRYFYVGGSYGFSDLDVSDPVTHFPPIYSILFTGPQAVNTDNYNVDDKASVWKLYGGYQIQSYFGVEAGYTDLGQSEINQDSSLVFPVSVTGGTDTEIQDYNADIKTTLKGFELTAMARYPFNDRFSIYGKMGGIRVKSTLDKTTSVHWSILMSRTGFPDTNQVRYDATGSETESHGNIDMTFGLGTEFLITENFGLRAEWQQYRARTEWKQFGIKNKYNVNTYTFGLNYRFGD